VLSVIVPEICARYSWAERLKEKKYRKAAGKRSEIQNLFTGDRFVRVLELVNVFISNDSS
jgi:hypothetical protein